MQNIELKMTKNDKWILETEEEVNGNFKDDGTTIKTEGFSTSLGRFVSFDFNWIVH